ncbi:MULTISPECIES: NADH-quinone oxidoreductase subunit L [unclassified Streptomyces]|uniref:NADH-quinone oxidoreductase subunit 5 family protein n=1 Tax=unclassified Streptomyces TaxID=2593676 RepID=UPI00036EBB90|nr:NADH-quinone oxidoreductase subunit L [Streptomyces sp. LaPpAH-202]MYW60977.1 NADH-quinone oxidoreductase subunit L [Streptomyces sp. SID8370]MYW84917.1 NADH-quinone oxidoreductase subunit L [Streptomyces sp. SID8371]
MTTTTLAVLVPVLPLLGALAGLALGRVAPGFVRPLAVLPPLAATVLAALVAARQHGGPAIDAATELTPTGSVPVELALHLDGFAVVVAVLVAAVATCVQLYSTGYLREDTRYPSYAALVSLFTSAMLLVVYSGDLIVLLVGWEVMGICSYFLVGHYWETPEARSASLKAFLVTKLGDVPFLIGLFALAADTGSFRITRILDAVGNGGLDHPTLIALLLLAGVAGKSAQFPLHIWLPDAMAGPTPVSALIHAATMVAAGVYFVARLLPVFAASAAALVVLAVMAAVTMAGSALAALAQDDIKRVLAYSTIGQLGYMTAALAVADRSAAVFHLLTHGAFKALLFLAAGALIHAAGTNSLTAMARTGALRTRAADAYWTMTVALLALAALPPFSGFFSKEAVLGAAERAATGHTEAAPAVAGWIVLTAGLATALLTAAYATRLWLRAFHGQGAERPVHGPQPLVMNVILWVLAAPSLALGLAYGVLGDWFGGASLAPTLTTSVLATGLALVGGLVTYGTWRHTTALAAARPRGPLEPQPESEAEMATEALTGHAPDDGDLAERPDPADPGRLLLGPLHRHAAAGFHLDAAARTLFVRPTLAAARLAAFLDREVVETYVRASAAVPRLLGAAVRKSQTGNAQTYLTVLLAGALVLAVAAVLVTAAGA